jgi:hypothetical protein
MGGTRIDSSQLWELYTWGKQTYKQLSDRFNCSAKTIQRKLDKYKVITDSPKPSVVNLLMDTTYFGRTFGVMAFKDSISGRVLSKYYVKNETNLLYKQGVEELVRKGFKMQSIVCDGRKGLMGMFDSTPMQMCQFHQLAIVTRYLTKKPKTLPGRTLRELTLLLTHTDKESFIGSLQMWEEKNRAFLNERTVNSITGKSHFTHKKLRSAFNSLKRNLPWLFTSYDNIHLNIPNTTNALDGSFADLKNKLRCHNGLSITRKKKFIDEFFKA